MVGRDVITNRATYDVVVMGGGLAGLSLARQILRRRPETTVLVLERMAHPVPEAAHFSGRPLIAEQAKRIGV